MNNIAKQSLKCGTAIFLCTLTLVCIHLYASSLNVVLETPFLTSTQSDTSVTLSWTPSQFSTSYRIYELDMDGKWTVLKAIAGYENTFEVVQEMGTAETYAVRACNISASKSTLSKYSNSINVSLEETK